MEAEQTTLLVELGVSARELRRFRSIVPEIRWTADGRASFMTPRHWEPGRDAASFAIDFCTRGLLTLQGWQRTEPVVVAQPPAAEEPLDLDALMAERAEEENDDGQSNGT